MKLEYWISIVIIMILAGIVIFFLVFDIETNNSRGKDFCKNNDMEFSFKTFFIKETEFYCTRILGNTFIEKEIKLSDKNWGFA